MPTLHHPRYAGVFCYGRSRQRKHGDARYWRLPREEWIAFIPNAHRGYISWEEYEANVARLRENSAARGEERRKSPPREGPALLQGLAICGKCGKRMTVRYHRYKSKTLPDYVCQKEAIERAEPPCQRLPGAEIDRAVGALAVETLTPMTLELTFAYRRSSRRSSSAPTSFATRRSSARNTRPSWPGAGTCESTLTIDWWPAPWR